MNKKINILAILGKAPANWVYLTVLLTFVFTFFTPLWAVDDPESPDSMVEVLEKRTRAITIQRDAPVYPYRALQREMEGWVVLRYTVMKDGTTADIEVLNANVENVFDEAVINAAKSWTYKPATRNGKPITQYNFTTRHLFLITGYDDTVSRAFQGKYRKALKEINGGDLETANDLIRELDKSEKRLLAEVCYLDVLKVSYYKAKDNQEATLTHVERALVIADDVVSKKTYIHLLKESVIQNAIAQNYQTSLERFATLQEVSSDLTSEDKIYKLAEKIKRILNGDSYIAHNGKLTTCKRCETPTFLWTRDLNRNRFSIDKVVGEISKISVVCSQGIVSINYQPDIAWSINKDWGACYVTVYGDEGTTLRLIEHQNEG